MKLSGGGILVCGGSHVFDLLLFLVGKPADAIIGAAMAMATTVLAIVVALFFLYSVPSAGFHETVFEKSVTGRCTKPLIEHFRKRMASRVEPDFPKL